MQGEQDAKFPAVAQGQEPNVRALVGPLRRDLNAPDLPFIFGQVNPPPDRYPGAELVRSARRRAAASIFNARSVPTGGLEKRPGNLHYGTAGQLQLGRRFARAFLRRARHRGVEDDAGGS